MLRHYFWELAQALHSWEHAQGMQHRFWEMAQAFHEHLWDEAQVPQDLFWEEAPDFQEHHWDEVQVLQDRFWEQPQAPSMLALLAEPLQLRLRTPRMRLRRHLDGGQTG